MTRIPITWLSGSSSVHIQLVHVLSRGCNDSWWAAGLAVTSPFAAAVVAHIAMAVESRTTVLLNASAAASDFTFGECLGKGSFGVVHKVQRKGTQPRPVRHSCSVPLSARHALRAASVGVPRPSWRLTRVGMGMGWSADKKTLVIKRIRLRGLSRKEQEEALNEVSILKSMDNEHIVRYYDSFIGTSPTLTLTLTLTLRARWVTLRSRWVTLRARWLALRGRCLSSVLAFDLPLRSQTTTRCTS
jgi:hypothetical protein